jgi:chromosomal replication initiation ATPase DnaA
LKTDRLLRAIKGASNDHFKLIIISGGFNTGKTQLLKKVSDEFNYLYLNLNLILSKKLLQIKEDSYITHSQDVIKEIFDEINERILLIDNIELLFSKEVASLNPVEVFKNLARDKIIVLSLPGKFKGDKIEYSTMDRNDYKSMDVSGLTVIQMEE